MTHDLVLPAIDFYVLSRITNGQSLGQDDVIDLKIRPIFTPVRSMTLDMVDMGLNL